MSDKYPCPQVLRFSRLAGEHHLLIGGGVLDQPVVLQAVRYAGYVDYLFNTRMKSKDFKPDSDTESDLLDQINEIRRKLLSKA